MAAAANSLVPTSRWGDMGEQGAYVSATYGAFVVNGIFSCDSAAFGISKTEARGLDPLVIMILETSYAVFHDFESGSNYRL